MSKDFRGTGCGASTCRKSPPFSEEPILLSQMIRDRRIWPVTIGVTAIAICGPTRGRLVFGHDTNVKPVSLDARVLPCTGCHFSAVDGFRDACRFGGCQALMRLIP